MEDSKMHRKETKLLNKTPNVSFHRNTPCGVDQENSQYMPPPLSPFDATHKFSQN